MTRTASDKSCAFCRIIADPTQANLVYEDRNSLAFLDHRPVFYGHVLVVPRLHVETLGDVPGELIGPLFSAVQLLARAVERGMEAQGTFVAMNNRVSQSVPHLHVHIVPRRKGDGLRGFFWPRVKYVSEEQMAAVAEKIRRAVAECS